MFVWNKTQNIYSVNNMRLGVFAYEIILRQVSSNISSQIRPTGVLRHSHCEQRHYIICLPFSQPSARREPPSDTIYHSGRGERLVLRLRAWAADHTAQWAGERIFSQEAALFALQYGYGGLGASEAVPGHKWAGELVDPDDARHPTRGRGKGAGRRTKQRRPISLAPIARGPDP